MNRLFLILCYLVIFFPVGVFSWALEKQVDCLIQKTDTAEIDWTQCVLNAVGEGTPPVSYHGNPEGRDAALSLAVENARMELLAAIKQIPIDADGTVEDLLNRDVAVSDKLMEMIEKAEVVHQEYSTDGSVIVTIRMSMYGAFSQLVLPAKIKQIESVKQITISSDEITTNHGETPFDTGGIITGPYTGMIIDVRGIRILPCMAPRVCDENGQEIFGSVYASREFAVQNGMTGYLSDMEAATRHPRVADRPLILKGLRTSGVGGTDIIVSNADAARLRSAFENLAFLRQCRVLIVVNGADASEEG